MLQRTVRLAKRLYSVATCGSIKTVQLEERSERIIVENSQRMFNNLVSLMSKKLSNEFCTKC